MTLDAFALVAVSLLSLRTPRPSFPPASRVKVRRVSALGDLTALLGLGAIGLVTITWFCVLHVPILP